jgi:hypothetical protein
MAIKANTETSTGGQFTADKSYYGETEDGRSFLKVAEGVTIPMTEAIAMGIVKGSKAAPTAEAPAETEEKAKQPTSNKSKTPSENK